MVACGTGSWLRSITLSSMRTWIGTSRSSTSLESRSGAAVTARPRLIEDRLHTTKSPAWRVVTIWSPLIISWIIRVGLMFCRISVHRLLE
ncbi:hypothetical protein D3C72_1648160 [compost metagenome]